MIKYFCDLCNKEIVSEEYVEQTISCYYDFEISCNSIICKECWEKDNAENTKNELNSQTVSKEEKFTTSKKVVPSTVDSFTHESADTQIQNEINKDNQNI